MKKIKRIVLVIIVLLLLTFSIGLLVFNNNIKAVDSKNIESITFVVEENQTPNTILNNLEKQGLIKSTFFAKLYLKINKNDIFQVGSFNLNKKMDLKKIIAMLNEKPILDEITITIPEGYKAVDFAKVIAKQTMIEEEDFLSALNDQVLIDSLASKYEVINDYQFNDNMFYKLEGLLAPNTYNFYGNNSVYDIIDLLVRQTNLEYSDNINLFNNSSLNINEIFTLASIIENEAKSYEDRILVASIFMNRLKQDISFGSDVTTYYGLQLDMGERDLTNSEVNDVNAYNTRAIKGFPVGPINSPSLISIKAALNYTTTDFLFFVSDINGKIYATKTYDEHNEMIDKLKEDHLWFNYE